MADQGAEGLFSPFLRSRRIAAVKHRLHGRVLDVGCGSGSLARFVAPADYLGFDPDAVSLGLARRQCPSHTFREALPPAGDLFDTIVALAVIEHIKDPVAFLRDLASRLTPSPRSAILCTTPHPALEWIHTAGASVGLFSRHASEEHETLLDRQALLKTGQAAGLQLAGYRRFLLGANQLAVYQRA